MSQATGAVSRNTAPVGPKSTAQANDYTSPSHQVTLQDNMINTLRTKTPVRDLFSNALNGEQDNTKVNG
jgi:hypothetical protein